MNTDQLFEYLSSNEVGVGYAIDKIFVGENAFQDTLLEYLRKNIEVREIEQTIKDNSFQILGKVSDNLDLKDQALIWIGKQRLPNIVKRYRIEYLKNSFSLSRPKPYNHPDLTDVDIDENKLIEIDKFEVKRTGEIFKANTSFRILQSIQGVNNSMYWAFNHIFNLTNHENIGIRLDPFLYSPIGGFLPPQYKMFVYGSPPEIEKIHLTNDERYVRWMPDNVNKSEVIFTDAVFQKRGDEVHFICEEIPKPEFSAFRGSRYFHSIYSLRDKSFIHIDGAIRLYEKNEIQIRTSEHVRKTGKIGKRVKLFQIDTLIPLDQWCNLAASFFVWNEDVQNFFKIG